ncbi:MAG: prenyltransferase/squalene oxidase repeat-containing protein [Bacillota bacterium]
MGFKWGDRFNSSVDVESARRFVLEHGSARERAEVLWVLDRVRPEAAVVADFLTDQRPDGGFGGIGATITALVHFDALGLPGSCPAAPGVPIERGPAAALARALAYLVSRQLPDGGWDEGPEDVGPAPVPWETPGDPKARMYLTAACCLELTRLFARPPAGDVSAPLGAMADAARAAAARGLEFLLDRRHANGRFVGFWHTTWLATSALAAARGPSHPAVGAALDAIGFHPFDVWEASQLAWMLQSFRRGGLRADRPPIPGLLARLAQSQRPDGSWGSEDGSEFAVFATVESLRAIRSMHVVTVNQPVDSQPSNMCGWSH